MLMWNLEGIGIDERVCNHDTAQSQHGYMIKYMLYHMLWKYQLQTEIALSSTESECIGLSYVL